MNNKKICFIICVNNKQYLSECQYYINNLIVPQGYEIDCITVWDAPSMTSGYNAAMKASEAKYKIYIHQDVFLVKKDFLFELLELFENDEIGMVGMIGSEKLPSDGCMWNGIRVGTIYSSNVYKAQQLKFLFGNGCKYKEVEAIDGLLMATQYDLDWREDLFKGWDFYDVSQSAEFIKNGYQVVVPNLKEPWCLHDDGFLDLDNYDESRKIYLREYKGIKE